MPKRSLLPLLICSVFACSASESVVRLTEPDTQPLATAAPADVGMDGALLQQAVAS